MKRPIPLGKWVPDNSFHNSPTLSIAKNVIGTTLGWGPLRLLSSDESAVDATKRVRGAMTFRQDETNAQTIAGTRTELYKRNSSGTWTDISDASYTTAAGTGFWSMTQFGDLAIMTNGADNIKKWDITTTPATVSDLGGSPPTARFVATIGDFLFLAHLESGNAERTIRWSQINDPETWTIGTNLADIQEFPDGGTITGLFGFQDYGIVFQNRKIRYITFNPGSPEIFQIDEISSEIGCVTFRGAQKIGNIIFFLANEGFYVLQGTEIQNISDEIVYKWYLANSLPAQRSRTVCHIDPVQKVVMWTFISNSQAGEASFDEVVGDTTLIYHWPTQKWSYSDEGIAASLMLSGSPITLEDLDSVGDLDSLTSSLDSSVYNTEILHAYFAAFGTDSKLSTFQGMTAEAQLRIPRLAIAAPERQIIDGLYPVTDSITVKAKLGPRETMGATPSFTSAISQSVTGWIPFHNSARMHDVEFTIDCGCEWTHFNSFYVDGERDGVI